MKKVILLGLVLVLLVAAGTLMYRKQAVAPLETLDGQCTAAGGTIKESLCCKGVDSGPQIPESMRYWRVRLRSGIFKADKNL